MSDEWGPWIEHDGKGCPCLGMFVHGVYNRPVIALTHKGGSTILSDGTVMGVAKGGPSWDWEFGWKRIIRYRVRKPRGLSILREIAANPQQEMERTE